jgi:hypothetical protein
MNMSPQSALVNSSYILYFDRSIINDETTLNNRLYMIMPDKTIKEAYSIEAAIRNSHNPYQHHRWGTTEIL